MMVIIRRHRAISMLPASCLSAFACAVAVLPLAHPLGVTGPELAVLALFGTTQFGMGLMLLTLGSRLISATRASLLGNVELPVAPFWGIHPANAAVDLPLRLEGYDVFGLASRAAAALRRFAMRPIAILIWVSSMVLGS
jgi:hypothetical protein